ncbi:uncharacterized protein LOC108266026 isoform X4 [Ictalurus punctatus]|uniref:Uncharacterized protein LOC108266026 isoform X4 n=1 Tax=Ictalurus punctatus TaxID=7998 RepID=A0A979ET11_ICTPU|nr:uncharacterized protein LOC108266026 isoform X4 [Ictalurus punctatus]
MSPAGCFIWLFILLLLGRRGVLTLQNCSELHNITCDRMGNAMLNTSEIYLMRNDCMWSFRDTEDKVLELLTPSPNVSVQCTLHEIRLKVHCITPKYEYWACYNLTNQTNSQTGAPSPHGTSKHRVRELVIIAVALFLMALVGLVIVSKKDKKATVKTYLATAQVRSML